MSKPGEYDRWGKIMLCLMSNINIQIVIHLYHCYHFPPLVITSMQYNIITLTFPHTRVYTALVDL